MMFIINKVIMIPNSFPDTNTDIESNTAKHFTIVRCKSRCKSSNILFITKMYETYFYLPEGQ